MHHAAKFSQKSAHAAPAHSAPSAWRDLKRDWRRWSAGERIAVECVALAAIAVATILSGFSNLV